MKKQLDWNEYHRYITMLSNTIRTTFDGSKIPYKYIAALDTDDMFVAIHLSHLLDIRVVTDINLLSLLTDFTDNKDEVLLVSNIVDTGHTFENIMDEISFEFDTAAIFKDLASTYQPRFYVEVPVEWVYFPWDHR